MKEQFGQLHKTVEAGQRKIMRRVQRLEREQCAEQLPKPGCSESSGSDTALEDNGSSGSDTAPEVGANGTNPGTVIVVDRRSYSEQLCSSNRRLSDV